MEKSFICKCNTSNIGKAIRKTYSEGKNEEWDIFTEDDLESLKNKSSIKIDLKYLEDKLSKGDMEDLNEFITILGIEYLTIYNIEKPMEFDNLPIKYLNVFGRNHQEYNVEYSEQFHKLECDYSKLNNLTTLVSDHVISLVDIYNLPNIENCYSTIGLIVNSKDEFKKANELINNDIKSVTYNGTDVLYVDDIKTLGNKVGMYVDSPLVFSDEICDNLNNEDLQVSILNDRCEYSLDEIKEVNRELRNILKDAPSKDASDYEKALYLYFKVGLNDYDHDLYDNRKNCSKEKLDLAQSLKGSVLDKKCICSGYALEYYILAKELELECNLLSGDVISKDGSTIGHEWNQVKIDDTWYNIDVTNDNFEGRKNDEHFYAFLIDDKRFNAKKSNIIKRNIDFSKSYEMDKPAECNKSIPPWDQPAELFKYYSDKFWKDRRKDDKTHGKQDDEYDER